MNKYASKKWHFILSFTVGSGSLLLYLTTLKSGFIWDDLQLILNPLKIGNNPYSFFLGSGGLYYRPFLYLSMLTDYGFWHLNPTGYHVTNMLLHMINSLLVLLLGIYLLGNADGAPPSPPLEKGDSGDCHNESLLSSRNIKLWPAFISALLFAIHPIHTESVAWISGRTDILSTFFFLLAFLSYMLYITEGKGMALTLSCLFFLSALFSKENAVSFFGVILLYGIILGIPKKKMFFSLIVFSIIFVFYLALRHGGVTREILEVPGSKDVFFSPSAAITVKTFLKTLFLGSGYYFEKLIFPFNLNLLPPLPEKSIYYLFFLLPLVACGLLFRAGRRLEFFLLTWVIITLLPSLPVLFSKMANPLAERYLYLPSVGFCILLTTLLKRIPTKKTVLFFTISIALVYIFSTHARLKDWMDDTALWQDTVRKNPSSPFARINFGASLLTAGNTPNARDELVNALKIKGIAFREVALALYLLGESELEDKNYAKAEEYFIHSIKADPRNPAVYNGLGNLYYQKIDSTSSDSEKRRVLENAINNYELALKLSPDFYKPMYYLGLCYLQQKDMKKAEKYFKSVIELDPNSKLSTDALKFLALIQLIDGEKASPAVSAR